MFIYNSTTLSFQKKCKTYAREIMHKEMNLTLKRDRFLWKNHLIPISFVVFEDEKKLGYFNSHLYQVAFNKTLMFNAKDSVLKDIIRHELAHFICHLIYKNTADAHGVEYRKICQSYGWGEEVYRAYMSISLANDKKEGDLKGERILQRIQKLMNLASSDNENESALATMKANELLLKYNLQSIASYEEDDNQEAYLERVLSGKRKNAKAQAIYEILTTFFVQPVFNHGQGQFYLEVIGQKVNVEIASYVAGFLDTELERLWERAKRENSNLKGQASKNTFMKSVAKGYVSKINEQKSHSGDSRALIVLEKDLKDKTAMVHGKMGFSYSKGSKYCPDSAKIGNKMGKSLSFKKGLQQSANSLKKLLSY
ncbi:DUF2786 domain-containing protein [Halobacteriovorax sp. GB3]|nr:DUF2786 domain-containing protein [Halobacteriovorax sp. GB3]